MLVKCTPTELNYVTSLALLPRMTEYLVEKFLLKMFTGTFIHTAKKVQAYQCLASPLYAALISLELACLNTPKT